MKQKILSLSELSQRAEKIRQTGERLVLTNGCFDLLHVGHVRYLQQARELGDFLAVAVNGDESVRSLKGPGRPVNSQKDRAQVLGALRCVDRVVLFSEDTPEKLIRKIRPDVLVKGGDWKKKDVVGARFVESYGGKVRLIPFVKGFSTTGLLKKIERL